MTNKEADEKYIINSVYDTDSEVVSGFNKGLMKSYKGVISEKDLNTIVDYLKTLNEKK